MRNCRVTRPLFVLCDRSSRMCTYIYPVWAASDGCIYSEWDGGGLSSFSSDPLCPPPPRQSSNLPPPPGNVGSGKEANKTGRRHSDTDVSFVLADQNVFSFARTMTTTTTDLPPPESIGLSRC